MSVRQVGASDTALQRCLNRTNRRPWDVLTGVKNRILELVRTPNVNNGLRISAVKFMQRVILVQTRGINDPRVRPSYILLPLTLLSLSLWETAAKQRRPQPQHVSVGSPVHVCASIGDREFTASRVPRQNGVDNQVCPLSLFMIGSSNVYPLPTAISTCCRPS